MGAPGSPVGNREDMTGCAAHDGAEGTRRDPGSTPDATGYRLEDQVGFLLRRAQQRHLAIFARTIAELTPTQFAAIARVFEMGPVSQAALGRATAMNGATVTGVIDRLAARGLVRTAPCGADRRCVMVHLTETGRRLFTRLAPRATAITAETLAPLSDAESATLVELLRKIS